MFASLRRRLHEGFGVDTRIMPAELLDAASQHYDYHRKRLLLAALLRPECRTFILAYQDAVFVFRPLAARMPARAAPPGPPTSALLHPTPSHNAAGTDLMPHTPRLADQDHDSQGRH